VIGQRVALPLPPASAPATAELTRELLLSATHELLYDRGGATVSISEICGRAGVNVAMVKYCFGNKNGLMLALITRITDSFGAELQQLAASDGDWRVKLDRHLREVVRNYMRYPYLTRVLMDQLRSADEEGHRSLSKSLVIPMSDFHRQLLEEARRKGELSRPVDPVLFFFSVVGMCEFVFAAEPWLTFTFGIELDDELVARYADHVSTLVLASLQPESPTRRSRPEAGRGLNRIE